MRSELAVAPARAALFLLSLAAGGTGCSWILDDEGLIQDRRNEYREAQLARVPDVPEDLDGSSIREMMPVPQVSGMDRYLAQETFELPRPATLFAREEDRGVRIQRFGGDSWIVAPDPPSLVWPRVKQFLSDNGVAVAEEDPAAGVMVSDWFPFDEASGYGDLVRSALVEGGARQPWQRLQLRVEQAVRRGATELHVIQVGRDAPSGLPDFSAGSTDEQAGMRLLGSLAEYLAAELGGAGVSFVAQSIATEAKAEIVRRTNAPPTLRLRLSAGRAWATVATALENAEIPVESTDEEAGVYRIRYDERQFRGEEQGWLARVFDSRSDDPAASGDPYVLRLEARQEGFELLVLDERERDVDRETGEQILSVLREFAS
ncbi:MAG: outer membrane protein assembly factor BamC [Pseudomonadales bacterium]|nr:outer membrane protein assembly factor BamC [Pseudomonadales bacterium]